jgi:hypothetical protein
VASQDLVALDWWTARHILYPIDNNTRHRPDSAGIDAWLTSAMNTINNAGGFSETDRGILVRQVKKNESEMQLFEATP